MPQTPFLTRQRFLELSGVTHSNDIKNAVCGLADGALDRSEKSQANIWASLSRDAILARVQGQSPDLRTAVVCDAAIGKTTNTRWLEAHIGKPCWQIPLFLPLDEPKGRKILQRERDVAGPSSESRDVLLRHLAQDILERGRSTLTLDRMLHALRRHQAQGRITLIIDGLDHVLGDRLAAGQLRDLLNSLAWKSCPANLMLAKERCGGRFTLAVPAEPAGTVGLEPVVE